MAGLGFHPAARVELVEAILYHEGRRPGYGSRFEAEVDEVVDRVGRFPESGSLLSNYPPELDVRAFPLRTFRYSLIVATVDDQRLVYAVAHQHRRPSYWRKRLTR